ncbi:MAG: H(+)/Cl(-) exchange transporter ClcA [Candidatus Binatia bacterium]
MAAARAATTVTPRMVRREISDFHRVQERRRRQLPRALLVGLLAGLVAVAFRGSLEWLDRLRDRAVEAAHLHPLWYLPPLLALTAFGAGAAVFLVQRYAPEASGSGIPHVKAVLHNVRAMRWGRILVVKFLGGVCGIGAGLVLGREGPTVQMGAAVGAMVGGWFASTPRERRALIAAGSGAGLAAAFNAPLAGLVFVLEEVQRDFAPGVFATTLFASATADVTTRLLLGQLPVFHVGSTTIPPLATLPASLLTGLLAGGLGVAFNRGLLASLDFFQGLRGRPGWVYASAVGFGVGLVAWVLPHAVGGGEGLVAATLDGQIPWWALPPYFVLRFALTMASYGCGAPGGIFAPLLVLGSEIGLGVGKLGHWLFPLAMDHPETFAVVGMAAYFAGIVRAPLTGIVLIVEMTGNYSLVLPLLVACLTAYGVADFLGDQPVYEALLERDLLRSHAAPEPDGAQILDFTVAPGADFVGKTVRELGLPPGAILISLRRGLSVQVPVAASCLEVGDHVTVLIAPEAAEAISILKRGLSGRA